MLNYFNLVVTTYRLGERRAKRDLLDFLRNLGDKDAACEITGIDGVLVGATGLDPFFVVEKARKGIASDPWPFRNIFRFIPIESVVSTDMDDIKRAALQLASAKIRPGDTFRVTVEKRHSPLRSFDIIAAIADRIDNKVDLESPTWVVLVEILEKVTGISVLRSTQIFSSVIERRSAARPGSLV
jgi:tRNA acetyltransferase TAN1